MGLYCGMGGRGEGLKMLFPFWYHFHHKNDYTQPLLFDDSMSILQKINAILAMLKDIDERLKKLEG